MPSRAISMRERSFMALQSAASLAAAMVAFEATARDWCTLLQSAWCGAAQHQAVFLGHCSQCWANGALAGVLTFLLLEVVRRTARQQVRA